MTIELQHRPEIAPDHHTVLVDGVEAAIVYWHEGDRTGSLRIKDDWIELPAAGERDTVISLINDVFGSQTLAEATSALSKADVALYDLRGERANCTDSQRHTNLTMPGGLIWQADLNRDQRKFVVRGKLVVASGISSNDLQRLIA